MNKPQLICLWIAIALVVLTGLLPPWVEVYDDGRGPTHTAIGHAWLFHPPTPQYLDMGVHLDYARLGLIWLVIAAVSGGAIFSYRRWQHRSEAERWPWRRIARYLYAWYLISGLLLALNVLHLLGSMLSLSQAANLSSNLQGWLVIDLVPVSVILLMWVYAQLQFTSDLKSSARWYSTAFLTLAGLGTVSLAIGGAAGDAVLMYTGLVRLVGGLLFGWVTSRMHRPPFERFYLLFEHLTQRGVPLAFMLSRTATPIDPSEPYTLSPDEPRQRIKPVTLLREIARGWVVLPADLRVTKSAVPAPRLASPSGTIRC